MRDAENISELVKLNPDFIGFIFYNKSKRFVSDFPEVDIPNSIKKVGVFVNETIENITKIVIKYNLDIIQLHGDETPKYCANICNSILLQEFKPLEIVKAFSVDKSFNFEETEKYKTYCNYFLFDTKGKNYGGTGIKFDWSILKNYRGNTPFFLSGGISKNDVESIRDFKHKMLFALDVNSGFEIEPGLKNIDDLKIFKQNLK